MKKKKKKKKKHFISPVILTFYFDVALDKRSEAQGSVFYVWLFSCNDSMSENGFRD